VIKRSKWSIVLVCLGTWLGTCLGTCLGAQPAQAQDPVDAESKVRALERLWAEAAQFRDVKALQSIFDDSLVYVHIDGRLMTKAQVLADTRAAHVVDIVVESSTARAHGNTVIVSGVLQLKGVERGEPYLRHGRFIDTWVNEEGHWQCVASMTTAMKP
jgi:ketosteroid isomerase-like protein